MIKKTDTSTEVKELENGTVDYIPDVIEANKIKSVQKIKVYLLILIRVIVKVLLSLTLMWELVVMLR